MANLTRFQSILFSDNLLACRRFVACRAVLIAVVLLTAYLQITSAQPSGLRLLASNPKTTTTISQHGITWSFDEPVHYGRFVNGDYWVIGPVTVTSVDPEPTTVNGNAVHGSMINPEQGGMQGYDSRGARYSSGARVSFPVTIEYDASLISSISRNTDDTSPHQARAILDHQAVLTVLMEEPPENAFRPVIAGADKTIRYTYEDIRWDKLPNLSTSELSETADVSYWAGRFERLWATHGSGINWPSVIAYHNYGNDGYHQYVARTLMAGAVVIASDLGEGTQAKEDLVVNYIQVGLEWHNALDSGLSSWYHWFFPPVFAGEMLGDDDVRNIYKNEEVAREYHGTIRHGVSKPRVYFGADQAPFVSDSLPTSNVAGDLPLGKTLDESTPWPGEQDTFTGYYARTGRRPVFKNNGPGLGELHPDEWDDLPWNRPWTYIRMHSVAIPGFTLAALAFDVTDAIGPHSEAYVAYARRWMFETGDILNDSHVPGDLENSTHPVATTRNSFVDAMWHKHEENLYD